MSRTRLLAPCLGALQALESEGKSDRLDGMLESDCISTVTPAAAHRSKHRDMREIRLRAGGDQPPSAESLWYDRRAMDVNNARSGGGTRQTAAWRSMGIGPRRHWARKRWPLASTILIKRLPTPVSVSLQGLAPGSYPRLDLPHFFSREARAMQPTTTRRAFLKNRLCRARRWRRDRLALAARGRQSAADSHAGRHRREWPRLGAGR